MTYKCLILFFLEFIISWFDWRFRKFVGVIFRDISCCWWEDEAAIYLKSKMYRTIFCNIYDTFYLKKLNKMIIAMI